MGSSGKVQRGEKCWPGVRGCDSNVERPTAPRAGVERGWGKASPASLGPWGGHPTPLRPHGPHSLTRVSAAAGLRAGRGAASPSTVSPASRAEVVLLFLGTAGPGADVSFASWRVGGTSERVLWAMILSNSFRFFGGRAQQQGGARQRGGWLLVVVVDAGLAGQPAAATPRGWEDQEGGSRRGAEDGQGCGRRTVLPFWLRVARAARFSPQNNDSHLPAPRSEVSKVNEKFHP